MRRISMIGALGVVALIACGCGSSTDTFKNAARAPEPINVTGSVDDSRVLISPTTFGAGPINLYVTNSATQSVSLIVKTTSGRAVATVQSINPDTPGEVKFNIGPGDYQVTASQQGIRPAVLHVGRERSSASTAILQP